MSVNSSKANLTTLRTPRDGPKLSMQNVSEYQAGSQRILDKFVDKVQELKDIIENNVVGSQITSQKNSSLSLI